MKCKAWLATWLNVTSAVIVAELIVRLLSKVLPI